MSRATASLPAGPRVTDYISLGVVASAFARATIDEVLAETGTASQRERDLPAHVVVYYVIALALYMQVSYQEVLRCLLEGLQWLLGPEAQVKVTGKSGISQARTRLGSEPLQRLHDRLVGPVAVKETRGAWFGKWRLVSLDGTTLAVADTAANEAAFGRPGESRGKAAYPLVRLVSLVESGTHVLFGTLLGAFGRGEVTLAAEVVKRLEAGMLCLADRNFFGYELWCQAQGTGCDLLWRVKSSAVLPCERRLRDGSYLSTLYPSTKDRRHRTKGVTARVIEYQLVGVPDAEPLYRLVTTILQPKHALAADLAALYHERWEIETALDELKTHLRGAHIVLRSKTPDLVKQEVYGLMMAHYAVRGLMHEAALTADEDPDRLSFTHAVRVVRRKLPAFVASPPGAEGSDA
ncbi:MAG: IS4 family transposase [Armatimonadetes bacterium]|nr:IS4 family transposase [Armatimonadota bacterium]